MRLWVFTFGFLIAAAMFAPNAFAYPNHFVSAKIRTNPYQYVGEALRKNISTDLFFEVSQHLTTYRGFEAIFKKATVHNPLVFKQGGRLTEEAYPNATPIAGPPFDIHTPAGTIPGCLNLLCPSPQGAIWFAGVCWCTK